MYCRIRVNVSSCLFQSCGSFEEFVIPVIELNQNFSSIKRILLGRSLNPFHKFVNASNFCKIRKSVKDAITFRYTIRFADAMRLH